jgi:diaminopropionate ammonia-lyase
MTSYTVQHLASGETFTRPGVLINNHASTGGPWEVAIDPDVEAFHRQLPTYNETKLHSLTDMARELGFANVFLKDESTRFGLPSFKILGASWAVHRAVCKHFGLPSSTALASLINTVKNSKGTMRIVTCTDGNWGRSVARIASILRIPATIFVPGFMIQYTQNLIRSEGAEVKVVHNGSYDDAIQIVIEESHRTGALMVMDVAWPGYEEVPAWVTEGYGKGLRETDRQIAAVTGGGKPDIAIGSVGVGSWMHAVTQCYKSTSTTTKVITVEPDTAACFKESLHCGELTSIATGESIMCGMNCGTPSSIAWPVLMAGVHAAATVTDKESHRAVEELRSMGVNAGPCGAATLAALRKLCAEGILSEDERHGKTVVLFSTEGNREYDVPQ